LTTLRRISAATLLSLTLFICVFAGQVEVPGAPAPAPTPANMTTQTTQTTGTTGITTEILLAVLNLIYL
jgi:hypothetical protein